MNVAQNNTVEECAKALQEYDNYVITAHINPDGDAYGSMVAMGYLLQKLGKRCVFYNPTECPQYLAGLKAPCAYYTDLALLLQDFTPQAIIVLDISKPQRMGELYSMLPDLPSFNIDHHTGCEHFGSVINIVLPSAAATGCIVARIVQACGVSFEGVLGEALYVAITSDTGNFRNSNTDAEVFRIAADICETGFSIEDFVTQYQRQWPLGKMRLWGALLSHFTLLYDDTVLLLSIPQELLDQLGATKEDVEGVNSFLLSLASVKIVALFYETTMPQQGIKLSLRSKGVDLLPLVTPLGGGGHPRACGVFLADSSLDEAHRVFQKSLESFLSSL